MRQNAATSPSPKESMLLRLAGEGHRGDRQFDLPPHVQAAQSHLLQRVARDDGEVFFR
jgi:hypothetical protein